MAKWRDCEEGEEGGWLEDGGYELVGDGEGGDCEEEE